LDFTAKEKALSNLKKEFDKRDQWKSF